MSMWSFFRRLFSDDAPVAVAGSTSDLPFSIAGDSFIIDNPAAYTKYFLRLGYDASNPTVQQIGVARRCMLKDAMRLCEGKRIRFRGKAPTGVAGAFIDWSKEYERIGGKHG